MEQQGVHPDIVDSIRSLQRGGEEEDDDDDDRRPTADGRRHRLVIHSNVQPDLNLQSVQYLVEFLRGESHEVTELDLFVFNLLQPSDGGLDVLIDFFENQTTLSKIILYHCDFGGEEEALQLIAAVQSNRLITDLSISGIRNLQGAAFGNCISGVLRNATHLQRLELGNDRDALRALQPGLRTNRHLKILDLSYCHIRDEGLRLIVDALVGNTTMEVLDIRNNNITSNGLDDITRLLELTQLKDINFGYNSGVFNDEAATQRFARVLSRNEIVVQRLAISLGSAAANTIFRALESNTVLEEMRVGRFAYLASGISQLIESLPLMKGLKRLHLHDQDLKLCILKHASFIPALHQNTSLEELSPNTSLEELLPLHSISCRHYSSNYKAAVIAAKNILSRNRCLHRADLLLALQPRTDIPIASKSGIWYKAMALFALHGLNHDEFQRNGPPAAPTYPGASAIFKILQRRPTIVGKQVQRPVASTASRRRPPPPPDNTNINGHGNSTRKSLETEPTRKRRRL